MLLVDGNCWSFLQNCRQATKVQQQAKRKRKQNYNVQYAAWKGISVYHLIGAKTVIIHHLTIWKMLRFVKFSINIGDTFWVWVLFYQLNILIPYDLQGFAEKLFSRLRSCNERFEVHTRIKFLKKKTCNSFSNLLVVIQKYIYLVLQLPSVIFR